MDANQIINFLNAIGIGELEAILSKVEAARSACAELGHEDLVQALEEASAALKEGDVKTFRKRIELAVSRLGHLK